MEPDPAVLAAMMQQLENQKNQAFAELENRPQRTGWFGRGNKKEQAPNFWSEDYLRSAGRSPSIPVDGPMPIGAPTASKQTGRFAGQALRAAGLGLTGLGAAFDAASLLNSDQLGKDKAREMAINLVNQGYTDYDEIMALAQQNAGLESAIGDIGASDYAKTAAGIGLQSGDILMAGGAGAAAGSVGGPVGMGIGAALGAGSALLGSVAQVDLQRKKAKRNEAFREQFINELIQRGMVK